MKRTLPWLGLLATLALQNMVVRTGGLNLGGLRLRIETAGQFSTAEDIGELAIRRSLADIVVSGVESMELFSRDLSERRPTGTARGGSVGDVQGSELVRIKDIATVREGYLEPAFQKMRFQGKDALAIQLANITGGNVLETGKAIDKRLAELLPQLPAGIEVERFVW